LTLSIGFKQPYVGQYQDRLELLFIDTQSRKRFIITQVLKAIVGRKDDHEELKPITPHSYTLRSMSRRSPILEVVEGIKPPATSVIRYVGRLPKAYIPTDLEKILSSEDSVAKVTDRIKSSFIPQVFNCKSHGQHFKYLLWIEEFRMK
jgi:helicase MOV-10